MDEAKVQPLSLTSSPHKFWVPVPTEVIPEIVFVSIEEARMLPAPSSAQEPFCWAGSQPYTDLPLLNCTYGEKHTWVGYTLSHWDYNFLTWGRAGAEILQMRGTKTAAFTTALSVKKLIT